MPRQTVVNKSLGPGALTRGGGWLGLVSAESALGDVTLCLLNASLELVRKFQLVFEEVLDPVLKFLNLLAGKPDNRGVEFFQGAHRPKVATAHRSARFQAASSGVSFTIPRTRSGTRTLSAWPS